ncbi:MAG: Flp pilus assembly protein CpaB [Pseudomonadota bacterium]
MDIKKVILLVGALIVAGISAFAVRALLGSNTGNTAIAAPVMELTDPEGPQVLVAQTTLPLGTIITAEHFSQQPWPADMVENSYFTTEDGGEQTLLGKVVRVSITQGQPITKRGVVGPGERGFLAAVLRPGQRAVTVPLDNISGVAGFIFPGDRVDILLNGNVEVKNEDKEVEWEYKVAETIVRNVRVIAIDQRLDDVEGQAQTGRSITFEVSPKMVEKIAVARELGTLSFSLRSIAETRAELEDAIARGLIEVGDDQDVAADLAMELAAEQVADASGSTYTSASEISRFAVGENGPQRVVSKNSGGLAVAEGPKVRVTRGPAISTVSMADRQDALGAIAGMLGGVGAAGGLTAPGALPAGGDSISQGGE